MIRTEEPHAAHVPIKTTRDCQPRQSANLGSSAFSLSPHETTTSGLHVCFVGCLINDAVVLAVKVVFVPIQYVELSLKS